MKNVKRPWGNFKQFVLNKKCTVKILSVKPNQELSLQKHQSRDEMWYFFTNGRVQICEKEFGVRKGEVIKIKREQVHRLIAGKKRVEVLEISFGSFKEKDETRLEDKYGRK